MVSAFLLLCICGCGPRRVRADFKNYEAAYAATANHELLLNLARLENHDPAYFFKLGQISSAYRMQASLTGNGQLSSGSGAVQIPTGGGTPGITYENDPTFQFIPVNDDTNARLLLEPIQAETFDALYQQGWRIDQLFRLLVDRVEITRPQLVTADGKPSSDCEIETIRNLPPTTLASLNTASQEELSSYVTFLRVSALVYELQRQGHLVLGSTEAFRPFNKDAVIPLRKPKPPSSTDSGTGKDDSGRGNGDGLAAKDLEDAVDKNNIWQLTPQGWVLGRKVFTPVFYLTPMTPVTTTQDGKPETIFVADVDQIIPDIHMTELSSGNALRNAMVVLKNGFSIQTQGSQQETEEQVCTTPPPATTAATSATAPDVKMSAKLILRSLIAVMAAAAQEQKTFEQLQSSDPMIPESKYDKGLNTPGSSYSAKFSDEVPPIEQIPLLTLNWKDRTQLSDPPLVEVNYRGHEYMIADGVPDPNHPASAENKYWNRDMFRLINALTSQVTVDISKFPLPEILQLHSD
jgi:hypothetical protein